MKKNTQYLTFLVFIIIIVLLMMFLFDISFFEEALETEEISIKPEIIVIDPTVKIGDKVIDFTRGEEFLTYAELIAAAGVIFKKWDFPLTDSRNWYDPYIREAQKESWIFPRDHRQSDYDKVTTRIEALRFFIRILESRGEDFYPSEISLYNEFLETNISDVPLDMKDFFVKSYAKGLLIEDMQSYNLNEFITRKEVFNVFDKILNPGKRVMPMLVLPVADSDFSITDFNFPYGIYFAGGSIKTNISIKNEKTEKKEYWVGLSFQDSAGEWYDISPKKVEIGEESVQDIELSWQTPENVMSGHYNTTIAVWDKKPGTEGANRLAHGEAVNMFLLYNDQENFHSLDKSLWTTTSAFTLGRTPFKAEHVSVKNGKLTFFMPANTFECGEVQSIDLKGYGSYEISMKIPDAPGSITGFFMYKQPDYYYEIDIEVYNQTSGDYFVTTYAEGKQVHTYADVLPFDPTDGFYSYRFDYYPDRLDYYIDGEFIIRYTDGYPKEPMHLIVNCWYPNWVPGGPAKEDRYFQADWIRY